MQHTLPGFLCSPKVSIAQPDSSLFMPSLFRILQTRSCIFILVLRWFCTENSSHPSKDRPLPSRASILHIFHRPCVVKVTKGARYEYRWVSGVLDLISPVMLVFAVIGRPSAPGLQLSLTFRSAVASLAKHFPSGNSGFISKCVRHSALCCGDTTPHSHTTHVDGVVIRVWLKQLKCLYICLIFSCPRPGFWKPWKLSVWNIVLKKSVWTWLPNWKFSYLVSYLQILLLPLLNRENITNSLI